MWLLPYEHLYIKTHLPYSMLREKLQKVTNPSGRIYLTRALLSNKSYYGRVTREGFRIHRWISNHRSTFFPPVIKGDFLNAQNGEIIIRIRFYLHWTAAIGMISWLLVYGLISVAAGGLLVQTFPNSRYLVFNAFLDLAFIILILICTYGTMLTLFEQKVEYEKTILQALTEAYESVGTV